jgi:N-glycosylase/DNA lyase
MPFSYSISVPAGRFDLELCVSSGQVFRWRREDDGAWFGVDGDRWYRVRPQLVRDPTVRTLTGATGMNRDPRRDALAFTEGEVREGEDTFDIESNGPQEDFARLFRLDWDADGIERELLNRGPELAPYLGALRGLRLLRPQSASELLFTFLCTPNNNIPRIAKMVQHLATFGPVMDEVDSQPISRFPDVATIAAIPPEELRARGFGYRANTIPTAAKHVLERGGEAYIDALRNVPYEHAHAILLAIPYVGRKLADCIALFGLHHTSAIPLDTHLWQVATRLYFPQWKDTPFTDLKYRETSAFLRARFGEWGGWAQQYLFFDNVLNWRGRSGSGQPVEGNRKRKSEV